MAIIRAAAAAASPPFYRVTLAVEYLGWDEYHFGHSSQAGSVWQRGAWQDWLDSCARWWNIQINSTQVLDLQSHPVSCHDL